MKRRNSLRLDGDGSSKAISMALSGIANTKDISCGPVAKKSRTAKRTRKLRWAKTLQHAQEPQHHHQQHDDIDASLIWYARKDYDDFLVDRVRTVRMLRGQYGSILPSSSSPTLASTASAAGVAADEFCIRGLEPYQDERTYANNRELHQTTILLEQVRQHQLGIQEPEIFKSLVAARSLVTLQKAQQQALLDEYEVYGQVLKKSNRRGSLLSVIMKPTAQHSDILYTGCSEKGSGKPTSASSAASNSAISFTRHASSSAAIRQLQELNARRLMEIYQQPGMMLGSELGAETFNNGRSQMVGTNAPASASTVAPNPSNFFASLGRSSRFRIRRDSLFGSCGGGGANGTNAPSIAGAVDKSSFATRTSPPNGITTMQSAIASAPSYIQQAAPTQLPLGDCLAAASKATNVTRQLLASSSMASFVRRRDSLSMMRSRILQERQFMMPKVHQK